MRSIMILFILAIHAFSEAQNASCQIIDGQPKITLDVVDTKKSDAWAFWNNSKFEVGWYTLHVEGREGADSKNMLRCAGFLEGYLSQKQIHSHYLLMKDIHNFKRHEPYSPEWTYFMEKNMNYTFESVESYTLARNKLYINSI